ncbi:hypothetical protein CDL62_15060 [Alkalitalea saponilacus]|nr:hypothetical protein CDL62_15060 [Alkalitalea saponilacus]
MDVATNYVKTDFYTIKNSKVMKNFKATFIIDGKIKGEILFSSSNPFHSESERIRDAKIEIELQQGIIPSRLSQLKVIQLD